jgi:hypothetical protein
LESKSKKNFEELKTVKEELKIVKDGIKADKEEQKFLVVIGELVGVVSLYPSIPYIRKFHSEKGGKRRKT